MPPARRAPGARPNRPQRLAQAILAFACLLAFLLPCSGAPAGAKDQDRQIPAWVKSGIVYELFPRNFSASGDFNGVTAKLDELHDLGINILWLMPVNPVGSAKKKGTIGSPYAVKDYYAINPSYGTEDDLKRLVAEAHKRNIRVILDVVLNHTAWDSVLMQHPEFYKHDANGKIIPPMPDWADVAGLNYSSPELRQYMINMLKHWIDPKGVNLDGFRCDVASMVPTSFWEEARVELTKVKPDVFMLAEASTPDLMVKAFDADYDWPLLSALNNVMLDSSPATELKRTWMESEQKFPKGTLHMRITDDHDESRAIARFGVKGALAASVFMFTLDGIPLLYNGMEAGDATESGDPALFEKMPVFWHSKGRPPLRDIYKGLIKLRLENPAFLDGKVVWLSNTDENNMVTLMRTDGHDEFVVVINFSNRPISGKVEVPNALEFRPINAEGSNTAAVFPQVALKGFDYRIYHRSVPPMTAGQ
ncbi:MAG: alpha-amylase family glycosyl hydrolase [Verrucomicrobiota bacterium]